MDAKTLRLLASLGIPVSEICDLIRADAIREKTKDHGVDVDGVLLKDGKYINFAGDFELQVGGVKQIEYVSAADRIIFHGNMRGTCQSEFYGYFMMSGNGTPFYVREWIPFKTRDQGGAWSEVARIVKAVYGSGVNDHRLEISRAGDITLLDDKFIKIGKDSDGVLPTASATYRGKMIMREGTAGERDRVYICLKSSSDVYSWVEFANGGA